MRGTGVLVAAGIVVGFSMIVGAWARAEEQPAGAGAGGAVDGARDPAKVAPEAYKVTLDNERVRVLDIELPKGGSSPMHSHPEYIVYGVTSGKVRFTTPDGKTQEVEIKAGQTMHRPAESHAVENIGDGPIHVLNIELKRPAGEPTIAAGKADRALGGGEADAHAMPAAGMEREHLVVTPEKGKWVAGPESLPAGTQMMVIEGDPTKPGPFTMRFKAPANYTIPPHWHPRDERVTVISGTLYMGMGDAVDKTKAVALPEGSYTRMPAKMHHFAYTEEPTTLQLHGEGPWGITYLKASDDPRNSK